MVGFLSEGEFNMDELLTLKEAAEFLRISERLLMNLLQNEDIPARKLGKEWRFNRDALARWVSDGKSRDYTKGNSEDSE